MAYHLFVSGERPTATSWNDWVGRRVLSDCTSSTRPASPVNGQVAFETDTLRVSQYNGSAWVTFAQVGAWTTYSPTWTTSGTAPVIGNGTLTGRYTRLGDKTIMVQVKLVAGSTTTFGTNGWLIGLPAGLSYADYNIAHGMASLASTWPVTIQVSGSTFIIYSSVSSANPQLSAVTATSPAAWGTGHSLIFTSILEAA